MVTFEINSEHQTLIEKSKDFADRYMRPVARQYDLSCEFPEPVVQKAYDEGIINGAIPTEYGGAGHSCFSGCLASEELGAGCIGMGICIDANNLALTPILIGGSDDQKKNIFGKLVESRGLAAFCLTEPDAGSDAGGIKTTAVLKGDKYIINGHKRFITNGKQAMWHTIFCATDASRGARGLSAIVVPADAPGIKIGRELPKMGQRASCQVEIDYENVEVPVENRLGKEGQGFLIAMKTLNRTRSGVGAASVGVAREAFDVARDWCQERRQFGQTIASQQAVQFMFADMFTQITASRFLVWNSAENVDKDREKGLYSGMAKMMASDTAMDVTTQCVQLMGGEGYSQDFITEKLMRDAKLLQIYEGTNQIQRVVIAKNILK